MNQPRFWAKTGKGAIENGQPKYHPVICHLVDTAAVAMTIVREYLSPVAKKTLSQGLELEGESLVRCCGFLAGCHDLGKVSPAFQFQVDKVAQKLVGETLYDLWHQPENQASITGKVPHGTVTAKTLPKFLEEKNIEAALARKLGIIVGGHHGFFPKGKVVKDLDDFLSGTSQDYNWQQFGHKIFEQLEAYVQMTSSDWPSQCDNAATMLLAGLTTVSDWIASNPDDKNGFPYADNTSFEVYTKDVSKKAKRALEAIGWTKNDRNNPLSFRELFPDIKELRELQQTAIDLADSLDVPCFILAEASMGEGKTEAAFFLADYFQQRLGVGGFYVGLPTQATSNAMYERVSEFLTQRYPKEDFPEFINLTLSHSAAALKTDYQESICRLDLENQVYDEDRRVAPREWHTARKRTLLSPYGVGTVDQALMGIVKSKHQFVRLFGLAGRTVIIDEIHAYDLYTSTLLESLLEWLALLGSPVIALSATLPKETRHKLITAYALGCSRSKLTDYSCPSPKLTEVNYPRLTVFTSSNSEVVAYPFSASKHVTRSLYLRWVNRLNWCDELLAKLSDGGCAAVICSTVGRAQEVFQTLQDTKVLSEDELGLFHGRFLFIHREEIEQKCLKRFGKPGKAERPVRYVLVATQVVEQSLDLDFDLMISDLAPIDLLLQRSGRLHRHAERNDERPNIVKSPELWLFEPHQKEDEELDFQEPGWIYDRHILLRTWLTTRHVDHIVLPDMTDPLMESVYDLQRTWDENLEAIYKEDWQSSLKGYQTKRRNYEVKAYDAMLPSTKKERKPEKFTRQGESDDENTIANLNLTRIGRQSVTVIFLREVGKDLVLPSSTGASIDLKQTPDLKTTQALLAHSTRISKCGLVEELVSNPAYQCKTWTSRMLKYARHIKLDEQDTAQIGKWQIRLDKKLGVVIDTT